MSMVNPSWRRRSEATTGPARLVTHQGPRTAFVLSGGGNQAVSEVGMMRALFEHDIYPDVVLGTSAGAMNGAAIAHSPTLEAIDSLADVWCSLRGDEIFPGGKLNRAWNVLRRNTHLFDNAGLAAVIDRACSAENFEDLSVPLRVTATDLDTGEEVVFASGPLKPALLASAALPGVFPPIRHDGRTLVDGAVVDTVPLWHALSGPVDHVVVCNVSGGVSERPPRSPLDVVVRAFGISRNQRFEWELRSIPSTIEVTVLPRPDDGREVLDFSGGETLIEESYALASRLLDQRAKTEPRSKRRSRRTRAA